MTSSNKTAQVRNYMFDNDNEQNGIWIDPENDIDSGEDVSFTEYDISASPNDFNIKTLFDFIDSGIVKIPGFQ